MVGILIIQIAALFSTFIHSSRLSRNMGFAFMQAKLLNFPFAPSSI